MKAEIQRRREPENRSEARHDAQHDGEIDAAGLDTLAGAITNLSQSGFRILIDEPLAADSVIWVRIGGEGPYMARVVWYDGMAAGCAFAAKLPPEQVARLLAD